MKSQQNHTKPTIQYNSTMMWVELNILNELQVIKSSQLASQSPRVPESQCRALAATIRWETNNFPTYRRPVSASCQLPGARLRGGSSNIFKDFLSKKPPRNHNKSNHKAALLKPAYRRKQKNRCNHSHWDHQLQPLTASNFNMINIWLLWYNSNFMIIQWSNQPWS